MVIGLAMCTTAAFAQIQKFTPQSHKVNMNAKEAVNVDYKASIFTKDGENDTLAVYTFANMDGVIYGDNGTVTTAHGNTTIDGDSTMFTHSTQQVAATWNYIPDSAYLNSSEFEDTYGQEGYMEWFQPTLLRYMGGQYSVGGDNGFMFMTMINEHTLGRRINAYFQLPAVATPADAAVIDVSLLQRYRKFNNDICSFDYQLNNGQWKSWEINIRGIDVEVNDNAALRATYTMPIELIEQDSIRLRIRWSCNSHAGGAFGYFWAVDDVRIISVNTPDRMRQYAENYPDGAYGIMPQGMKIPLAWFSNVSNNGANDRTNIHTVVSVLDAERSNPTTLVDNSEGSLAAGQPSVQKLLTVDERDFFALGTPNSSTYWFGYSSTYGTTTVPHNYKYLPVETTGDHYVTVSATSTGIDPLEWDTINYKVVGRTGDDNTLFGYRWAHDNGLVGNESRYYPAFSHDTDDPESGDHFWDYNNHYSETGYMVTLRYTTGSEIPVDPETGEPWALLGVEIVPTTSSEDYEGMDETEIQPVVMTFHYDEADHGTGRFADVATGVSTQRNHIVSVDDEANYDAGTPVVDAAGEIGADYKAVVIPFPAQPYLTPNLSYYIGYQLQTPGYFAAAATTAGYTNENDSVIYYRNDEQYRNRAAQFAPYGTDVYLWDGSEQYGSIYAAMTDASFPMIRAIVGPRIPRPEYDITVICDPQQEADSLPFTILNFDQNVICDQTETFFQGSAATYYVVPDGAHGYVKEIVIDGVAYDADGIAEDEVTLPEGVYVSTNPYNYTDSVSGQIALWRNYYVVEFEDVQGGHDLSANGEFRPWTIGIDPVANECVLAVQPNPATSQVKVNISGVSGMVNCNIIDMSGRVVYNSDFNAEQSQVIDLNSFARGAYFVRVTNGTFSKIEKLIVR